MEKTTQVLELMKYPTGCSSSTKYPLKKKKILFIYFLVRGREGEREGEKQQYVVASYAPPTGGLARNPDMCPD